MSKLPPLEHGSWAWAYREAVFWAGRHRRELVKRAKTRRDVEFTWRYYKAMCDEMTHRFHEFTRQVHALGYDPNLLRFAHL